MFGQTIALDKFARENKTFGQTKRERDATRAELYNLSRQYDGLADWYDKGVPLRNRKPRIIVPLPRKIVEHLDRFLWSGSRAPKAAIEATIDPDDTEKDEIGPLVDPEQAEFLSGFLAKVIKQGKLLPCAREYTTKALITTSALVIVGVKAGYLTYYVHSGKDCAPKFKATNPRDLESVEIKYQFPREVAGSIPSMSRTRLFWYRRVITEAEDITYQEEPVIPGQDPQWQVDAEKTVKHNLGYCPARWVRTFPDCSDAVDGKPLIDPALYPLFDAINYTISQKQRAVEYAADPQPWRQGVPEADRENLEKNPGKVWDLPGGDKNEGKVGVGFLEANGTGAQRAGEHFKELNQVLREVIGIIDATPEIHSRQVTGAALEMLYAPMIALTDDLRFDLGDEAYVGLLNLVLRVIVSTVSRGEDVYIAGVKKAAKMLAAAQMGGVWLDLPIVLRWSAFFSESAADKQAKVTYTRDAQAANLISKSTATRALSPVFDVDDHAGELEAIEDELAKSTDYGPMAGHGKTKTNIQIGAHDPDEALNKVRDELAKQLPEDDA